MLNSSAIVYRPRMSCGQRTNSTEVREIRLQARTTVKLTSKISLITVGCIPHPLAVRGIFFSLRHILQRRGHRLPVPNTRVVTPHTGEWAPGPPFGVPPNRQRPTPSPRGEGCPVYTPKVNDGPNKRAQTLLFRFWLFGALTPPP